jgi:hypothetical protein
MKTRVYSTVFGLTLGGVVMLSIAPLSANPEYIAAIQVRVVDARGKIATGVPLRACEVVARATACGAIFDEASSDRNGTAMPRIPFRALPHGFRVEPSDSRRSNLVVSYLPRMGCISRFTKEYAPVAVTCDPSRSTTSAFQPARTTDTYSLSAAWIETILGKKP